MGRNLRPSLYRTIKVRPAPAISRRFVLLLLSSSGRSQVVLTDGSTFQVPSAVRMVSKVLPLERDPANHPLYLVRPPPRCACSANNSLCSLTPMLMLAAAAGFERPVWHALAARGGAVVEVQKEGREGFRLRRRVGALLVSCGTACHFSCLALA